MAQLLFSSRCTIDIFATENNKNIQILRLGRFSSKTSNFYVKIRPDLKELMQWQLPLTTKVLFGWTVRIFLGGKIREFFCFTTCNRNLFSFLFFQIIYTDWTVSKNSSKLLSDFCRETEAFTGQIQIFWRENTLNHFV